MLLMFLLIFLVWLRKGFRVVIAGIEKVVVTKDSDRYSGWGGRDLGLSLVNLF
uniref:Uncharacterized protein n=1 Tax=Candidatus Kentrum sp. LFY TaxID=2126342 RepID=A0A450WBL2_9GAMM|nr:MAG: hypothetical protein BECKLFY1418C_GA0070996_100818 [Candidatus Kentron sp. LFY]